MNKKVVVAMSGGVDSSVAAALLKEQGYDVYGLTMKLANRESREGRSFGGCCGSKDFFDARSVAQTLGIPHYSYDYVETFKISVIDYFKSSYIKGETPNPCIACNQHVKFDALLKHALALGADYLATGHYAQIESYSSPSPLVGDHRTDALMDDGHPSKKIGSDGGRDGGKPSNVAPPPSPSPTRGEGKVMYSLKKGADPAKDQTYVLYGLGQAELSRLLFPLGGFSKTQIRELARKYGLKTADKPDSYEICFVPNEDYKQFIDEEVTPSERPVGPIRHKDGRVLGQHRGLPYYTIGQREGLGIAVGHPLYVVGLETATNTLVVGEKPDVYSNVLALGDVTWVSGQAPTLPLDVKIKIRSKHSEASAQLVGQQNSNLTAVFDEAQSAVTPGQAAVFYQGDVVLGGGVIKNGQ